MGYLIAVLVIGFIIFIIVRKTQNRADEDLFNDKDNYAIKEVEFVNLDKYSDEEYLPANEDGTPGIIVALRNQYKGQSLKRLSELYFDTMEKLLEAERNHNYKEMLKYCQLSFGLIEPLIKYWKKEYKQWDINGIPAITKGLIYNAVYGNSGQLKNIQDIVNYFKELDSHKEEVVQAFEMRDLAAKIYHFVKDNPDFRQSELKKHLNVEDGRIIANAVHYMENVNRISKRKEGNKIYLTVK